MVVYKLGTLDSFSLIINLKDVKVIDCYPDGIKKIYNIHINLTVIN